MNHGTSSRRAPSDKRSSSVDVNSASDNNCTQDSAKANSKVGKESYDPGDPSAGYWHGFGFDFDI